MSTVQHITTLGSSTCCWRWSCRAQSCSCRLPRSPRETYLHLCLVHPHYRHAGTCRHAQPESPPEVHVLSRLGGIQLAVLHPRRLVLYSMASVGTSQAAAYLEVHKLWEHQLERSAACMVCGNFGSSRGTQQAVQPHLAGFGAGAGAGPGRSYVYTYWLRMPCSARIRTNWQDCNACVTSSGACLAPPVQTA